MKSPETLARWLADNDGDAGLCDARMDYDEWLRFIGVGWAPSAVSNGVVLMSGAEAVAKD